MSFTFANTIDDVLVALAAGARPIAGGTDLVVGARHGKAPLPDSIVAIDRIGELQRIHELVDGRVVIGATVSHATLVTHALISSRFAGLSDASALVGSPATRHVGTLGGNVMNGSPAMDTGAPLTVLGATAELRSIGGSRSVTMGDLWIGPGRTSARPDELCVAIHLPAPAAHSGSAYVRLEYRRAMEIAVVGAAASVTLHEDGTVASAAVALTAVGPVIISLVGVGGVEGKSISEASRAVAKLAEAQATPISDLRASDKYRRHTVAVMARRAVEAAARRAAGEVLAIPVNRSLGIGASL
jgi:CO/xanthine dehydrogenase FAD-binding subunit